MRTNSVVNNGSVPLQFAAADNLNQIETERRSRHMLSKTVAVPSMHPGGLDAARSGHFGHCDVFTLIHVENGEISDISVVQNPPHQQGGCQAPVNLPATEPRGRSDSGRHRHEAAHGLSAGGNRCLLRPGR